MQAAVLWRATRAYSLPASVVPVLVGTALAARGYGDAIAPRFAFVPFVITLLGAMLAHVGANVLNDYFDFVKGVDTRPEHGSGVLTSRQMTPAQALWFAALLFAGAAGCALLLLPRNPQLIISLSACGLACAVLYPAFLKKYGLGDLLIMIAFGVGLTLGAYGVQIVNVTARGAALVALYSAPVCLLVDAILHANNLRDAADDRAADVATLATILPRPAALMWQRILLFGPLVFVGAAVLFKLLPVWSLATFLALPLLVRAYRTGTVEGTAQTHLAFGVLYTAALLAPPLFV